MLTDRIRCAGMSRPVSVALLGALALGASFYGCGGGTESSTTTAADSTVTTTTAATTEVKTVDLRKAGATQVKLDGDWLVATDDDIWVSAGTKLYGLDPKTGERNGDVSVPGGPCLGGVYAFGALYEPTCYTDEGLVRIDPPARTVTDSIPLPTPDLYNQEGTIAAGEGAVWMVIDGKGCESCVLAGFDPDTLKMTHEIDLDQGAESVAVGNGLVWVSDSEKNRVLRIDPTTDKVVGETKVGGLPRYIAWDSTGLWVLNQLEGSVMQLDPDSGEVTKTIEADMSGSGGSITVAEGSVWVRGTLTLLKQIDAETGEIIVQYGPDQGTGDALVKDGVLWVSAVKELGHLESGGAGIVYRLPLSQAG
jgi:streptogramin lyase